MGAWRGFVWCRRCVSGDGRVRWRWDVVCAGRDDAQPMVDGDKYFSLRGCVQILVTMSV